MRIGIDHVRDPELRELISELVNEIRRKTRVKVKQTERKY